MSPASQNVDIAYDCHKFWCLPFFVRMKNYKQNIGKRKDCKWRGFQGKQMDEEAMRNWLSALLIIEKVIVESKGNKKNLLYI